MLKSKFGKHVDSLSMAVGRFFSRFGLSPNAWTLLTLFFALPGFMALCQRKLLAGLFFFFLSGFIDLIDGAVARASKRTSKFGAFLDGVADRYVEFLLYLGLWFYLRDAAEFLLPNGAWMLLLLFGALMPSFIRAYAHHKGLVTDPKALEKMGGLIERSERLDLLYLGMALGYFNEIYLVYSVALIALLCHITSMQRILFAVKDKPF